MAQVGLSVVRGEDGASSWEFAERPELPYGLGRYVARMTGYDEHAASRLVRREVPTSTVTLIVGLGDPIDVSSPTNPTPQSVTSFVAGMHTVHVMVESTRQYGIQLDLTPLGAYRLLGRPMSDLTNQVVPLDAVRGRRVAELTERLATASSWADRFTLLDQQLSRWADDGPEPDRSVSWAWGQLARSFGQVPIGLLAEEIGWSRRHFATRFREQVGIGPKPAGRVLRFVRAVELLQQPSAGKTIASVAALCGYSDHSHMVREFQALAGCTPTEHLNARLADTFGNPDDPQP